MDEHRDLFSEYRDAFVRAQHDEMGIEDFLHCCKGDRMAYASAHECVLEAIGKPKLVNTADDPRLSRIFQNRVIQSWDTFSDFHGMEETLMQLYAYFLHAAQGLEERKQVLYLLGPVGGGKSSLAEKIKALCERYPIYALKDSLTGRVSPLLESPLGLFNREKFGPVLEDRYGIPRRALTGIASPWALKRLAEYKGDITKFNVVRVMPSVLNQVGIVKTEPGDENTQDISTLVGKIEQYQLDNGSVPTSLDDLVRQPSGSRTWLGPYAKESDTKDPWGRAFQFAAGGDTGYEIKSLGKDGKPGGDSFNRDISSAD